VPKAAELIADTLRKRIVLGQLQPGDALMSESELMVEFKVSRASLREAFRILEVESLIEIKRGARGGARVTLPSDKAAANTMSVLMQLRGATLSDVFDAMLILEPPMINQLAKTRSAKDLKLFHDHLEWEAANFENFQVHAETTIEFHQLLGRCSKNVVLALILGVLDEVYRRHTPHMVGKQLKNQADLNRQGFQNRKSVVDLIEARDGDGAESLWRKHSKGVKKILLAELGDATVLDLF
tara:strand:- start:15526 stop:16245 length:720 start_codon:yes stop_codon:yes gene_type:complete